MITVFTQPEEKFSLNSNNQDETYSRKGANFMFISYLNNKN